MHVHMMDLFKNLLFETVVPFSQYKYDIKHALLYFLLPNPSSPAIFFILFLSVKMKIFLTKKVKSCLFFFAQC